MQSQIVLAVLLSLVCGAFSQQVVPMPCNITVQQNFNLSMYFGKWYEIEKSTHVEEFGGICVEANYADFGNGSVEVYNTQIMEQTGQLYGMRGNARPLNASSSEAKYLVSFPSVGAYDAPYWVLDSDYENYSIVWSCRPYGNNNSFQTLWFLARSPMPTSTVRDYVHNKLDQLGLTTHLQMETTVQDKCNATMHL